jgi:hypothetical protein
MAAPHSVALLVKEMRLMACDIFGGNVSALVR